MIISKKNKKNEMLVKNTYFLSHLKHGNKKNVLFTSLATPLGGSPPDARDC